MCLNPDKNFADRWHEDNHARAHAFFAWADALQKDLLNILAETNPRLIKEGLGRALGTAAAAKHFNVLGLAKPVETPPHIHITSPPKPWKGD
ncbi:hypothetical protein [Candidatus Foliamicus sp.]